jgi:hypothetical protein
LGVGLTVAAGVVVARWVGGAVAVALAVGVAVAVARAVGVAVAVARAVGVSLALEVAFALDVGLPVGLAAAELAPVPPDEGEGVRDVPPEAVPVVACGVDVAMDGAVEEGDPPPLQAATATASRAAPVAARPARSKVARTTAFAAGTVRRTFMKPPRTTGGQWRRSAHPSMCHTIRR